MTTPNTDPDTLYAEVYQILVDYPVTPPTYAGDAPLGQKRHRTAQLLAEFVSAAVKRGQAEALRETADWWGANPDAEAFETEADTRNWMRDIASEYEEEAPDEQ